MTPPIFPTENFSKAFGNGKFIRLSLYKPTTTLQLKSDNQLEKLLAWHKDGEYSPTRLTFTAEGQGETAEMAETAERAEIYYSRTPV